MSDKRQTEIVHLLNREAELLDERRWDEWIELMTPDMEYWIPAWDSALETTSDPNNEMSLVYYSSRQGLEDRVFRIKTQRSAASNPLPRTCHVVTNVRTEFHADSRCIAKANWQVHSWRHDQTSMFYGFYRYELVNRDGSWRIQKKKTTVLNALINTVLDIYLV